MLASESIFSTHAGLRGPGKYCGVVVFDRWDTCFLLSGPYITYVSERVKNELRPYAGKSMQLDASDVLQANNPGDALIRKYEILGPAPDTHRWVVLDGLQLTAESEFGRHGAPIFLIEIRNVVNSPVEIDSSQIGPALLGPTPKSPLSSSDGFSGAVITRGNLVSPSSWECTSAGLRHFASYSIDPKMRPSKRFQLGPGKTMKARITFKLPSGQYQFIFGYGGGVHEERSLASNAISFDLSDKGIATLVQ